jgi:hypothetical protein
VSRKLLATLLLVGLLVATVGPGGSAGAPEESPGSQSSARCRIGGPPRSYFPKSFHPKGQPILVGPIIVGCGRGLDEPVRFTAYVQRTAQGGEQLCYGLEQPRQKAETGGSCFQMDPSLAPCREGCPLIVEATVAKVPGTHTPKGSLVTGAAPGVIEEVGLLSQQPGVRRATLPFVVILKGRIQKTLRLPSVVSLFATVISPCISAKQTVEAKGTVSGEKISMLGSDPFGCRA